MNKVIFIVGTAVISLLGALFFFLGALAVSNSVPSQPVAQVSAEMPTYSYADSNLLRKIENVINVHPTQTTFETHERHQRKITIDTLLQDIASRHTTSGDKCMSAGRVQKVSTQFFVFVGCFDEKSAYEISRALQLNSYVTHVEYSAGSDSVMVLCGPFHSRFAADTLYKWLLEHGYSDARMIEPAGSRNILSIPYNAEAIPAHMHQPVQTVVQLPVQPVQAQPVQAQIHIKADTLTPTSVGAETAKAPMSKASTATAS